MSLGTIFLSYRRDDSEGYVGRLYDHLKKRFPDRVFRDVTELRPGEDFVDALQREGLNCKVLLAIIGRRWLTVTDADGHRRLADPNDILRQEIARALQRNILVMPVLVGGASMPQKKELPPDLITLCNRQALPITELDFEHDMGRLIGAIEEALGEPVSKKEPSSPQAENLLLGARPARRAKPLRWIIGSVVATIVVLAIIGSLTQKEEPKPDYVRPTPAPYSDERRAPPPAPTNEEESALSKETTSTIAAIKSWRDRVKSIRSQPMANAQQMQSKARQLLSALDNYDRQLNNLSALLRRADVQNLVKTDEDRRIASAMEQLCDIWKQQSARIRYQAELLLQYNPYNTSAYDLQAEIQTIDGEISALDMRAAPLIESFNAK